jgi:DNA adenine methylase
MSVPAPEMKVRAIAPWFGGKRTLAPVIVGELGDHRAYWEPFGGSLPVLLEKQPSSQETVSDLHGDLINLAWVIADERTAVELYAKTSRTPFSEALFERARRVLSAAPAPETADVERAYWYFVFSWMGRNGLAGTSRALTSALAIRYTSGGGSPVTRFRSAVESIPPWHYRICDVLILRRDAFTLLPEIEDSDNVVVYVDSPYLLETRSAGAEFEKGARYVHDFDSDPQSAGLFVGGEGGRRRDKHELLAGHLKRFKHARIVISYYDHPRLRDLYRGWTFRDVAINKNIAAQNRRGMEGGTKAPEVLIINGPSYATVTNDGEAA